MAVVAVALGWLVAGRVLRPLWTMTSTTRHISERNLRQRLAQPGPRDELKDLGDTIDELLARLEGAFDAQRRFVANASHELRTPLSLSRALLQVAREDPHLTRDALRSTCHDVLAAQDELVSTGCRISEALQLDRADWNESAWSSAARVTSSAPR